MSSEYIATQHSDVSLEHRALPEPSPADQDVEDRADAPDQADQDPDQLLEAGEVIAPEDVDEGQDERDGVQEDRDQDLEQKLHCASYGEDPLPVTALLSA